MPKPLLHPLPPWSRRRFTGALGMLAAVPACTQSSPGKARPLRVFAASSLREAMTALARGFERAMEVPVDLVFAGSQTLRLQVEHGARADLLASAHRRHVDALAQAGHVVKRRRLARAPLAVAVPAGASRIRRFVDLAGAGRIVAAAPSVPAGIYTEQVLERARAHLGADFADAVRARIVSFEPNVRLVRAKVAAKAADAGFVYRPCVRTEPRVTEVPIPPQIGATAVYEIAVLAGESGAPEAALAFAGFATGRQGAAILATWGFEEPVA